MQMVDMPGRMTAMREVGGTDWATEETTAERWYALSVKPRHDKAVSQTLRCKGYQTLVPLYRKQQRYAMRLKDTELPLFPGYVFCRFNPFTRLPILTTPGVLQILGAGRTPIPIEESEMASLQIALRLQFQLSPYPYLRTGRRVRITDGALAGVEGIIVSLKACPRIVLSVTILQRSVLLEIDRACVSAEGLAA